MVGLPWWQTSWLGTSWRGWRIFVTILQICDCPSLSKEGMELLDGAYSRCEGVLQHKPWLRFASVDLEG